MVIGAGGWGTAMARLLANKGYPTRLWVRDKELAQMIEQERENKKYLPGVKLPGPGSGASLKISTDLEEITTDSDIFLLAVPSFVMREIAKKLSAILPKAKQREAVFINLAKGLERRSFATPSEVLAQELQAKNIFTLSGPCHAEEVGRDFPTTVVLAGKNLELGGKLQRIFMTERFRVYLSDDIKGVELASAVKNIIAIAAGISDGLGYGDNTKGALIARGLAEMIRLGERLGARKETFFGLAGLGDLVATCTSLHSRNRYVGFRVAKGDSLKVVLASMDMVAEGVYTVQAVPELAKKYRIEMPISQAVYAVLYQGAKPRDKLTELMTRQPKMEEI